MNARQSSSLGLPCCWESQTSITASGANSDSPHSSYSNQHLVSPSGSREPRTAPSPRGVLGAGGALAREEGQERGKAGLARASPSERNGPTCARGTSRRPTNPGRARRKRRRRPVGGSPRNGGAPGLAPAPGPTRTRNTEVRAAKPKMPPGAASLQRAQYQLGDGGSVRGSGFISAAAEAQRAAPVGWFATAACSGRGGTKLNPAPEGGRYGVRRGPSCALALVRCLGLNSPPRG